MARYVSPNVREVEELVRGPLAERLLSHGYRRRARKFYRASPESILVVAVCADYSSVTVRLGVYFHAIEAVVGSFRVASPPHPLDCTLGASLGQLVHGGRRDTWPLGGPDVAAVSREIGEAWRIYGRTWLEENATYARARETLAKRGGFHAAMGAFQRGEREEAGALVDIYLGEEWSYRRAEVSRWALSVGLRIREQVAPPLR